MPFDTVTERNWGAFEGTMHAEECLYAALDLLDAPDTPPRPFLGRDDPSDN